VISIPSTGDGTVIIRLGTASTDTESGTISTYLVLVNGNPHGADQTGWTAGNDKTISGLTNGVQVAITVKARDGAGLLGAASNSVNATPSATTDTTPDAFSFVDQTGVALSSTITSAPVTITGISAPAAISVTDGTYSINGGSYTSASGSVANGDAVRVSHTSAAGFSTATNTTVTIGGVSDTFTSTTVAQDTVPNAFSFVDAPGQALNTMVLSNPITVAGINSPAVISVTGGSYRINGTGSWFTTAGTVANGDTVEARGTSSGSYSTAVNVVVTIGGVSDTFTITTAAIPATPTLTATPGNTQNSIAFDVPTGTTDIDIWAYQSSGTPDAATIIASGTQIQSSGTTSPKVHSGLTNGQKWWYTAKARNTAGSSAASTPVSGIPHEIPAFEVNFLSDTIGQQPADWTLSLGTGTCLVVDGTAVGAQNAKALELTYNLDHVGARIQRAITPVAYSKVVMRFKTGASGSDGHVLALKDPVTGPNYSVLTWLKGSDNKLKYGTGGSDHDVTPATTLTADTWYEVTASAIDWTNHIYDLLLDGVSKGSGFAFGYVGQAQVGGVEIAYPQLVDNAGSITVDWIRFYN
jgi:hypothetical protein